MFISEDNNVELKEKLNNSLAKEIVAFLNTEGGVIYIGIKDSNEIVGINNIDEDMRKILDIITDQISPTCVHFVNQYHEVIEDKHIIKIEVNKGNQLFYIKKYGMSEAGCYIRIGTTSKSLTPDEIQDRFIKSLIIHEENIIDIPSRKKDLTFKI